MKRIHAFEFEDLSWFPAVIREAGVAYLRFAAEKTGQADNILPVIESALDRSGQKEILDLCSGGGGPILAIGEALAKRGRALPITLTDLYPSENTKALVELRGSPETVFEEEPVDATAIGPERTGLRTLFNAFHHFRPEVGVRVLADAVASRQPIAVVEVMQRGWLTTAGILFAPLITLLAVPFLRPFH